MSYKLGSAYPVPGSSSTAGGSSGIGTSGYNSSAYFTKGSTSSFPGTPSICSSTQFPSSNQFSYTTGNPYAGQISYPGPGPLSATKFSPGAGPNPNYSGHNPNYSGNSPNDRGRGGGRGRGRRIGGGRGGRGGGQSQAKIIKPKPPRPLSNDEKTKIENQNMKQLVAPKPPHCILNEMMGGGVRFEYTENPPLPPDMMMEQMPAFHTLMTEIDGDTSTGTGPSHEIAKNICAEHAIMGVVSQRYHNINEIADKGLKTKAELLLEDETPFELASIAVFKMLNEWEAGGYELPPAIDEVLYAQNMFVPVKQRLGWIRGSNLGFTTPLQEVNQSGRKRPMTMLTPGSLEQKNPVSFLNEIRGTVDYIMLGTWGTGPNMVFTMGVNIEGVPYSGNGPNKKEAKAACAKDILSRLYRINTT